MASTSAISVIKDILTIIGGVGAVVGTAVGIWLAFRKRAETKQREIDNEEKATKARLNGVTHDADKLKADAQDFRYTLKELSAEVAAIRNDVASIRTGCVAHSQQQTLADLKTSMQSVTTRLEKLSDELRTSYTQSTAHYNDMSLINGAIDALRKQIDSVNNNMLAIYAKKG